jgi:hypothetical protein
VVPVGKGRSRQAFGLVMSLPCSAALRVVFTLACGVAEVAALYGTLGLRPVVLRPRFPQGKGQVERGRLRRLPQRWPDVDRCLEVRASRDGFVRVAGVDYSVPPRLAGRRLGVRLSLAEVTVACEGAEVARHARSWVPADVVLAPAHARQLRLAREAAGRLAARDPHVATVDLARYDQLVEVTR